MRKGMKANKPKETVNHPKHYGGDSVYETLKVLEQWFSYKEFTGLCRGQAIIYLSRADKKGDKEDDLKKAAFYINYELDYCRRHEVGLTGNGRARLREEIEGLGIEDLIQKLEFGLDDKEDDTEYKGRDEGFYIKEDGLRDV